LGLPFVLPCSWAAGSSSREPPCGAAGALAPAALTGHAAQELTTERIVAEADLKKQLGTLRYLQGLKAARQRVAAAAQGMATRRVCTRATRGVRTRPVEGCPCRAEHSRTVSAWQSQQVLPT